MIKLYLTAILLVLTGCASVPLESPEESDRLKQFNPPTEGKAGLYIYRSGVFGGALKKNVYLNGECIGETAPNVFFYEEVDPDTEHKISTESEFSDNDLVVQTEKDKLYFIEQFIKMGVFVGGAGVRLADEEKGKREISQTQLAVKGNCG